MVAIFAFVMLATIAAGAKAEDRPIFAVLLVSYFYYCICGTFYWGEYKDGVFLGIHWGSDAVYDAGALLSLTTLLLGFTIWIFSKLSSHRRATTRRERGFGSGRKAALQRSQESRDRSLNSDSSHAMHVASLRSFPFPLLYWFLLAVGLFASGLVLAKSSFSESAAGRLESSYFLIAYQVADLMIPLAIYTVARRGYSTFSVLILGAVIFYSVLAGFRYKLAILFFPLLWQQWTKSPGSANGHNPAARKWWFGTALAGSLVVLFSAMTLYRKKFGIPDVSQAALQNDWSFGLFAESNILFGLRSIMTHYADQGLTFTFSPLVDTVKQWLPRVLFPDRLTGQYLLPMRYGYLTQEGFDSGTAYPWIGEYLIMFGYSGVIVGPLILASLYTFAKHRIIRHVRDVRELVPGFCLLAATLGYYNFSRGNFPQIAKAYIFIVIPYVFLCMAGNARSMLHERMQKRIRHSKL